MKEAEDRSSGQEPAQGPEVLLDGGPAGRRSRWTEVLLDGGPAAHVLVSCLFREANEIL